MLPLQSERTEVDANDNTECALSRTPKRLDDRHGAVVLLGHERGILAVRRVVVLAVEEADGRIRFLMFASPGMVG